MIVLFNKTIVKLDEYERNVEADIRKLKTRLALVTEARNRKVKKLENIKNLPPERIVFGGKKLYSEKDTVGGAKFVKNKNAGTLQKASDEWKQEFFEKRHQSMVLPGRHTSKYGNFLCKYDGKNLSVTCIDGTTTVFHDFKLPRYNEVFRENFTCKPEKRQSLCYNFTIQRDKTFVFFCTPVKHFFNSCSQNIRDLTGRFVHEVESNQLLIKQLPRFVKY